MIDALSSFISSTSSGINSKNSSNSNGNSGFDALLASLTDSNNKAQKSNISANNNGVILEFIQQVWLNIDNSLMNIGSDTVNAKNAYQVTNPIDPTIDASNTSAYESMLSNDGPLPRFLHEMDVRLNLNATQRQALRDIAMENKDVIKSPDVVQKIAMQLQRAGIYAS